MSRTTRRLLGANTLALLGLLWATGFGSIQAGEILWQYDTGG